MWPSGRRRFAAIGLRRLDGKARVIVALPQRNGLSTASLVESPLWHLLA